ncbi:MAG: hypothetical protein WCF54_17710 [Terracidiphilus sp.]
MTDSTSSQNTVLPFPTQRSTDSSKTTLWSLLYFVPALATLFLPVLCDNDVWWHLRTGEWIYTNHAIPTHDIYSISLQSHSWTPYSWLFELLVYGVFRCAGLRGIVLFTSAMVLLITLAIRSAVRRLMPETASALALTIFATVTLIHLYTPRPWLFSIIFFAIETGILLKAIHSGPGWELAWLPPLFIVWANIHIQFVDGLVILVIATISTAFLSLLKKPVPFPALSLAALTGVCTAATFVTPYGWNLYRSAHELTTQPNVLNNVTEMLSLNFRDIFDYNVILFAIAAAVCLALSRKAALSEYAFLLFGIVYSLRSKRDIWILVILSTAIIAQSLPRLIQKHQPRFRLNTIPVFLFGLIVLLFAYSSPLVNESRISKMLSGTYPVDAARFVQAHNLPGPLFNTYGWGGYLIWNLHRPVSIDGRAGLYGDKAVMQNIYTWTASPEWTNDAALADAKTIIAPIREPLTQLLRVDPQYQILYQDKTAIIFGKLTTR